MNEIIGTKVKDKITGFAGLVTGYCEYISGCNQALVSPGVDEKGAHRDPHWFDVQRLERTDTSRLVLDNGTTPGCDIAAPIR